jgi:hypothetical protein
MDLSRAPKGSHISGQRFARLLELPKRRAEALAQSPDDLGEVGRHHLEARPRNGRDREDPLIEPDVVARGSISWLTTSEYSRARRLCVGLDSSAIVRASAIIGDLRNGIGAGRSSRLTPSECLRPRPRRRCQLSTWVLREHRVAFEAVGGLSTARLGITGPHWSRDLGALRGP